MLSGPLRLPREGAEARGVAGEHRGRDHLREMGGALRNPAPRNHFLVWIVKASGCRCTDGQVDKNIVGCRPLCRALPLSLVTRSRAGSKQSSQCDTTAPLAPDRHASSVSNGASSSASPAAASSSSSPATTSGRASTAATRSGAPARRLRGSGALSPAME